MRENSIGTQILRVAIDVHRELGPGLLETVYEVILARELSHLGLKIDREVSIPIIYKGIRFDEGFRADLIIEESVLLELKSVELFSKAALPAVLMDWTNNPLRLCASAGVFPTKSSEEAIDVSYSFSFSQPSSAL